MKRITMRIPDDLAARVALRVSTRKERDAKYSVNDYCIESLEAGPDGLVAQLIARGKRELERFSEAELNMIRDACNGYGFSAEIHGRLQSALWMHANVEDAIRMNQVDAKWSVDGASVLERMRSLSTEGKLALLQDVTEFWGQASEPAKAHA